jgi:hypothetical protein
LSLLHHHGGRHRELFTNWQRGDHQRCRGRGRTRSAPRAFQWRSAAASPARRARRRGHEAGHRSFVTHAPERIARLHTAIIMHGPSS